MKAVEYVFEVRAKNGTDPGYSPVKSLAIQIIAPLYQRTWFIALVMLAALGLTYWLLQWNEKRKRRIQQLIFDKKLALESERLRISNDMHDDLGSGLSALHLRTKLFSEQIHDPKLKAQMKELEAGTNRLTHQIWETICTINSKNDTIDSLVTKLHQYAVDYLEATHIQSKVELMPEQNHSPIPGLVRREIFLTFKEALHNIHKHAEASFVSIKLYMDDDHRLVIDIRDNGHGFDAQAKSTGLGLTSMKKRIQEIGGKFELFSGTQGTRITITYG
jgi:signal transduction histidine kinase